MEDVKVVDNTTPNAMDMVLDLQALDVHEDDNIFGNSCSSSGSGCCNC